jgi:tetratricopeptide (TPR) repeat protein
MKTFSVFISSTIEDLKNVRSGVEEELTDMEIFEAVRVENLPAVEEDSRNVCLKGVADADAIVIILCERYGYIPSYKNPEKLSVTHLEYREAKRLKKPIFVFIKEGVAQEENLQRFTQEVSDFDDGVFRKTWETTNTLRDEIRRSLLFWLARLARERKSNEIKEEWVDNLSNYPELHEIQTLFQASSTSENNHNSWIQEAFNFFSEECRKKYLPVPKLITAESIARKQVAIEISIINNSRIDRLYVTLKIIPFGNTEKSKSHLVPPIEIDVAKTSKGALFISKCAVALTFLALDDWSQGIDYFLDASNDINATQKVRARLIGTAAYISISNQGQRSLEIVRKMLGLKYIDSPTVSAGAMALIAAELRLENSRAKHALFEVEKLSLEFLIYALESGQTSSETLYNLARQLLRHSLDMAIVFYSELVRTDSSYDERWYYHRDLGLIQYDLNNYQEAAKHYDKACHLKQIDSELFRFAGDAYYYQGKWTDALVRYEEAIQLEPIERYFLDQKVDFSRKKISKGELNNKNFLKGKNISYKISSVAEKIAEAGYRKFASPLFTLSKRFSELNYYSDIWLALYANRKTDFKKAILHLFSALSVKPEDPSTRLNLVMNMIFLEEGKFTESSREHMKITIFHGGPSTREQFKLRLINTKNKNQLIIEFDELFELVKKEREDWSIRRKEILKPEKFGEIMHFEFRE